MVNVDDFAGHCKLQFVIHFFLLRVAIITIVIRPLVGPVNCRLCRSAFGRPPRYIDRLSAGAAAHPIRRARRHCSDARTSLLLSFTVTSSTSSSSASLLPLLRLLGALRPSSAFPRLASLSLRETRSRVSHGHLQVNASGECTHIFLIVPQECVRVCFTSQIRALSHTARSTCKGHLLGNRKRQRFSLQTLRSDSPVCETVSPFDGLSR